jgi:hypothetical protein
VSETILTASISGQITGGAVSRTPEGNVSIPRTGKYTHHCNGLYYLTYNHAVELQVVEAQFVSAGDLIGRASPAAIRHGGAAGLNQVDEFEWGLREASSIGATGLYPYEFLPESDQIMLRSVLSTMRMLWWVPDESFCLVNRID